MSTHKRGKTPDPIVPEDTPQEESVELVPVSKAAPEGPAKAVTRSKGNGRFTMSPQKKLERELRNTEKLEKDIAKVLHEPAFDKDGNQIFDDQGKPVSLHIAIQRNVLRFMASPDISEKAFASYSKWMGMDYDRVYGRPKSHPVEREEAGNNKGFTVILSNMNVPLVTDDPQKKKPKRPSWIEGEVVEENPPKEDQEYVDPEGTNDAQQQLKDYLRDPEAYVGKGDPEDKE